MGERTVWNGGHGSVNGGFFVRREQSLVNCASSGIALSSTRVPYDT